MSRQNWLCAGSTILLVGVTASLAFLPAAGLGKMKAAVSFRQDVEPILKAQCSSCHSVSAPASGLAVETPSALFRGGSKFGVKIVVPGQPGQSVLLAYLRGTRQPRMPMGSAPLSVKQIAVFSDWISQGAKIDAVKLGWPYQAPKAVNPPTVKNKLWVKNPIDAFVLARLEKQGLTPAPPASKISLLRRVFADVVGVLPSPAEADLFLRDSSPDAYEKLVDRLLADPRYGERWGRHWLDLVRYADTHGFEADGMRPRAWRYRDYVIQSLNADKPYDRFLREQLAGDELYPDNPDALVATGYARLGPWDEISGDRDQRWQDTLNDVTDTTGSVMLGLTVGCARCHNHKYDPISQADYYRLQAFFIGTKWADKALPEDREPRASREKLRDARAKLDALRRQSDALREKYQTLAQTQTAQVGDDAINAAFNAPENKADRDKRDQWQGEIRSLESDIRPIEPVAEAVTDSGPTAPPQHILLRGNRLTPGPEVQPGFVASLCGGQEKPAVIVPPTNKRTTGRRTALANWIGSPTNPMTARVIVNRLWQGHFGRGIVVNPSDFGKNGGGATHSELLDWLAVKFMHEGWSLKKTHKLMLLSAAYRQSSQPTARAAKLDPDNALFSRMNRIRLDAEALRDSILAASGRLNLQQGGPGVYPKVSDEVLSTGSTRKWGNSLEDQQRRRTVYVFQRRSLPLPLVEAFDGPDMTNSCPRRSTTTIAPQALALFNGEFGRTESRAFAERVAKDAGNSVDKQIVRAYRIALCRPPTASQMTTARQFLRRKAQMYVAEKRADAELASLADFCHVLINTNEFIYLD